jgi:cellobiose phosphorylase
MHKPQSSGWHFIDSQGTFELENPQYSNYLYFPLVNQAGMVSSITPTLNGDAKTGQNTFLLVPVTAEDLHNNRSARNFWVNVNGTPWSATGNSAMQIGKYESNRNEPVTLQAGFVWHTVNRCHTDSGLCASVTNFVPASDDAVELMRVTLTNQGHDALNLLPTAAIPIYGRSADNLRDHRHVTSLLHRTRCHEYGVLVKPSMTFNENGHLANLTIYAVLGVDENGIPPLGFSPLIEEFIGEGGCLEWPQAIIDDCPHIQAAGSGFEGFESIGGLHFSQLHLQPGQSKTYVLILAILSNEEEIEELIRQYGNAEKFETQLQKTKSFWKEKLSLLQFDHGNARFDGWLQWVTLQPTLRRIMGNSFLPYHDYGRGGRGWRDLWQDLLALAITEGTEVGQILIDNFAGVRIDGSNANIVGITPGTFIADRNNIPRVWMDHAAWPLLTTKLYLDLTGDLGMLMKSQTYFKDHLTHRCQQIDSQWRSEHGTALRSVSGEVVQGTILEHLLVQHLTAFFNVGEHNIIRLEGGDWNDGFDMAIERGESVAFSAIYAGNLRTLSKICLAMLDTGIKDIPIAAELLELLDRISGPIDYRSIKAKQTRLQAYYDSVSANISGEKILIPIKQLASDLLEKGDWLASHICEQEWVTDHLGYGWFNGYYDNNGNKVEGVHPEGVRMTLTGQVFSLMAGIASKQQADDILRAADHYLYDKSLKGYRLNTHFSPDLLRLGRAFGFGYGHKENGAVFNHMAIMFAYALYTQGLASKGWKILDGIYTQSQDFENSRIYPGIPEYFNPRGRGMYPYLTGSAAWYLFTLLTEAYGVKGRLGDLLLEPKLVADQFMCTEQLKVRATFAGKLVEVIFNNPKRLSYGHYAINNLTVNGVEKSIDSQVTYVQFSRNEVNAWPDQVQIMVNLA